MTSKRTVVVAVAVAVGVLASVLSYVFLNNAQQDAYHNAKLVPAYVITKTIPRTLTGSRSPAAATSRRRRSRPSSGPALRHQPLGHPQPGGGGQPARGRGRRVGDVPVP